MDARKTLAIVLLLATAGCVAPVRVTHVTGPDGRQAIVLSCHHEDRCLERAGELCPSGYNMLNQRSGFAMVPTAYGPVAGSRETIMVECKG